MSTARPWVIWSEEHLAWWSASQSGYTRSLLDAGRCSEPEAALIVEQANRYIPSRRFNEIAIPDPLQRLDLEARINDLEEFIKTLHFEDEKERNKARALFGLAPLPLES